MDKPTALRELADRCEAAAGPDRELDGVIDRLFNKRPKNGEYDAGERAIWRVDNGYSGLLVRGDGFARGSFSASAYTASLDAAMSLARPNWWLSMGGPLSEAAYGYSREDQRGLRAGFQMLGPPYSIGAIAATLPLAVCAASLRALASMEDSHG